MKRPVRPVSTRHLVKVVASLPDPDPSVRYQAHGQTITVAASNPDLVMAASMCLSEPVAHADTVILAGSPAVQDPVTLTRSGWMRRGHPAKDFHIHNHRQLSCSVPAQKRSVTVDAAHLQDMLEAYHAAPETSGVIFDTHSSQLTLSINGQLVRASATLRTPLTGNGDPATVEIPLDAVAPAARTFTGQVTISVGPGAVVLSGNTARDLRLSISFRTPKTTSPSQVPPAPNPDRRRHDVHIDLRDWAGFARQARRPVLDYVPIAHLRLSGTSDARTLQVDTRSGATSHHLDIACSTSDRFAVDLPWPALVAVLSPATRAAATTAELRVFDPNPRLTPLVVTYRGEHFTGWAAAVARKPVIAA